MNCFGHAELRCAPVQIVSLTYLSQHLLRLDYMIISCELLWLRRAPLRSGSDCIFDIPITTPKIKLFRSQQLWIALATPSSAALRFRLYLWHTYHNNAWASPNGCKVVNCFQIVSLTYLSQRVEIGYRKKEGCELLWLRRAPLRSGSDCIFDIPITTAG